MHVAAGRAGGRMRRVACVGGLLLLALGAACSSSSSGPSGAPLCDASEITSALSKAGPGDTVRIGACRVTGSFAVPAGVRFVGADRGMSTIVGSGGAAIIVAPGASTTVSDLSVESDAVAAITAIGAGQIAIA